METVRARRLGMTWTVKYDPDKEMDTTTIEEEEWIDYTERSTVDALDKMEHAKIRCWNRTHKK